MSTNANFDPDGPGFNGNLFGLPFHPGNAAVVVIPVPWEVTVSYRSGAAAGPAAILRASRQVDLATKEIPEAWRLGIAMLSVPDEMRGESDRLRELALKHLRYIDAHGIVPDDNPVAERVNEGCENLNIYVKNTALRLIRENRFVGVLGGDHSVSLGLYRALADVYDRFGILQIDAHADLRNAYQAFTYSHASIMHNALRLPALSRLVQVGVRDYAQEELRVMAAAQRRIVTFFDTDLRRDLFRGTTWDWICDRIIAALPDHVCVSLDIDGLQPALGPNTGTPVPGGLEYAQFIYLLKKLAVSGKKIIAFDLTEVAPGRDGEWDANVGARLLYELCNWMGVSQHKIKTTFA